jgi:hypothetical protein
VTQFINSRLIHRKQTIKNNKEKNLKKKEKKLRKLRHLLNLVKCLKLAIDEILDPR